MLDMNPTILKITLNVNAQILSDQLKSKSQQCAVSKEATVKLKTG